MRRRANLSASSAPRPGAQRRLLSDDEGELAADRAAQTPGVFLTAALSGYGTMSACAADDLCARAAVGAPVPFFAGALSLARSEDKGLMGELESAESRVRD